MKKLIILFGVLGTISPVFGQTLKSIKLDSLVSVSLPVVHSQKDTLGQQIFSANTDLGYMMAIRETNAKSNQPLKKEKDLNNVLKNYVKGIQKQQKMAVLKMFATRFWVHKSKSIHFIDQRRQRCLSIQTFCIVIYTGRDLYF